MGNPMMESSKTTDHLKVRVYGSHLAIYSEDEGEKVNRAQLTVLQPGTYQLSMSNHRGKWEPTPYTGTLSDMLTLLTEQFPFMLDEW